MSTCIDPNTIGSGGNADEFRGSGTRRQHLGKKVWGNFTFIDADKRIGNIALKS